MKPSLRLLALGFLFALCNLLAPRADAVTLCGMACPAGQHPVSYYFTPGCCSSPYSCVASNANQVTCATNTSGSFLQCGRTCPSGFHAAQFSWTNLCCTNYGGSCTPTNRNRTLCYANTGPQFEACGGTCPAGYSVTRRYFDFNCCGNTSSGSCTLLVDNAVTCRRN